MFKKLKKITSLQSFLLALGEGNAVLANDDGFGYIITEDTIEFINDWKIEPYNKPLQNVVTFYSQNYDLYSYKYEEWWENIPEKGTLCWVSNETSEISSTSTIEIIKTKQELFYPGGWKYATPLTNKMIEKYYLR